MNYNEKINEISINITREYQDLMSNINKLLKNSQEHKQTQGGLTIPLNVDEANQIDKKINKLREDINSFNYYTAFYPNKENTWKEELDWVAHVSNIINTLQINNIREEGSK